MKTLKVIFVLISFLLVASNTSVSQTTNPWLLGGNNVTSSNNYFGTNNGYPVIIKTNGTEKMRIQTDGKIGIGITVPKQEIHLNGNILLQNVNNGIFFGGGGTNKWGNWGIEYWSGGLNFYTPFGSIGGLNNYRLFLKDNGCVGIGTNDFANGTDPNYFKLSVNGYVRAKEMYIYVDWPDFVFNNDYLLMPLDEVEKYISKYKHLPNIPTADEIKESGVSLGKTQSLLLQKIEELILYAIQQSKEMKLLKDENEKLLHRILYLEKENKNIDKRIKELEKKMNLN
jgi:hypothetical protein